MAVDLIGSVASTQSNSIPASALGQDDFLKILLTQLTYQDPLKPLDNQEFIAQMAQFSALEQSRQLNEKMDQLLTAQAANQSFGLIGKRVQFANTSGQLTDGTVSAVKFTNGQALLSVVGDGQTAAVEGIRLSSLTAVYNTPVGVAIKSGSTTTTTGG